MGNKKGRYRTIAVSPEDYKRFTNLVLRQSQRMGKKLSNPQYFHLLMNRLENEERIA